MSSSTTKNQAPSKGQDQNVPSVGSVAIIGTRGYPSYYGGFETAVRKLAPFLAANGWDTTVYGRPGATWPDDPDADDRVKSIETRGLETKSISTLSFGLSATWHAFWAKPDVALVMNVANGYFLPLLKLRGIPTLVNVDGIEWDRAKWGKLAKAIFRGGAWMTAKFADRLIFDSYEIGRRWKQQFQRDGVFIPYGGDIPPTLPIETGLEHRNYVLLVARFVPENTVPEFIEAATEISKHLPVVIVGSSGYGGILDDTVAELAQENENIIWLGHVSDDARLLSLWQHTAVYFHGHSVGGTNPTLVQAMAAGSPVVARDTPYNREVLPEDSSFFQPTRESITMAVLNLANDPAEQGRRSSSNLSRAKEVYNWHGVNGSYNEELTKLVKLGVPVED